MDLAAYIAYEIELALEQQQFAVLVTMDVQGAFDSVLRRRLLQRMIQQGWDPRLVRWVASFMESRRIKVRFENAVTEAFSPECGLP